MKKIFKIISLILVILMISSAYVACSEASENAESGINTDKEGEQMTEKPTEKPMEKPTQKPTEKPNKSEDDGREKINVGEHYEKIKTLGRSLIDANGIICDHSAAGIEFCGTMVGDVEIEIVTSGVKAGCNYTYFTVYIDGVRQNKRFSTTVGPDTIKIASFEQEGEHTIAIVKQTESNYTCLEIKNIIMNGTLNDAPANKELFIEFIGDSLTCGMGNIGVNSSPDPQTPMWEDATQSYGYMIAEDLDADYSIVSQSGIGIAGSWFDPLFDFYTKASYSRNKQEEHPFFLRTPDLIVINLGTNDYYLNKDKDPNMCKPAEVEQKTEEFIELVRSSYGKDIPIVWAYGFVGTFLYDNIKAAIDKLGGENAGIYMCAVPSNTGGAQWHPNVSGHRAAADALLPLIRNILDK